MTRSYCDRCGAETYPLKRLHDGAQFANPFAHYVPPQYADLCTTCFDHVLNDMTRARRMRERVEAATKPEVTR